MVIIQITQDQLGDLIQKSVRQVIENITPQAAPPPHQPDELLTVQQAAEFLHLSIPTVYAQVSRGELPVMKRNKRLYFSREELTAYLKEGRKKTSAEMEAEAVAYISSRKKGLNNGK